MLQAHSKHTSLGIAAVAEGDPIMFANIYMMICLIAELKVELHVACSHDVLLVLLLLALEAPNP